MIPPEPLPWHYPGAELDALARHPGAWPRHRARARNRKRRRTSLNRRRNRQEATE